MTILFSKPGNFYYRCFQKLWWIHRLSNVVDCTHKKHCWRSQRVNVRVTMLTLAIDKRFCIWLPSMENSCQKFQDKTFMNRMVVSELAIQKTWNFFLLFIFLSLSFRVVTACQPHRRASSNSDFQHTAAKQPWPVNYVMPSTTADLLTWTTTCWLETLKQARTLMMILCSTWYFLKQLNALAFWFVSFAMVFVGVFFFLLCIAYPASSFV